jgi:hypothetical protein
VRLQNFLAARLAKSFLRGITGCEEAVGIEEAALNRSEIGRSSVGHVFGRAETTLSATSHSTIAAHDGSTPKLLAMPSIAKLTPSTATRIPKMAKCAFLSQDFRFGYRPLVDFRWAIPWFFADFLGKMAEVPAGFTKSIRGFGPAGGGLDGHFFAELGSGRREFCGFVGRQAVDAVSGAVGN